MRVDLMPFLFQPILFNNALFTCDGLAGCWAVSASKTWLCNNLVESVFTIWPWLPILHRLLMIIHQVVILGFQTELALVLGAGTAK
jgi:hypothetical protein